MYTPPSSPPLQESTLDWIACSPFRCPSICVINFRTSNFNCKISLIRQHFFFYIQTLNFLVFIKTSQWVFCLPLICFSDEERCLKATSQPGVYIVNFMSGFYFFIFSFFMSFRLSAWLGCSWKFMLLHRRFSNPEMEWCSRKLSEHHSRSCHNQIGRRKRLHFKPVKKAGYDLSVWRVAGTTAKDWLEVLLDWRHSPRRALQQLEDRGAKQLSGKTRELQ